MLNKSEAACSFLHTLGGLSTEAGLGCSRERSRTFPERGQVAQVLPGGWDRGCAVRPPSSARGGFHTSARCAGSKKQSPEARGEELQGFAGEEKKADGGSLLNGSQEKLLAVYGKSLHSGCGHCSEGMAACIGAGTPPAEEKHGKIQSGSGKLPRKKRRSNGNVWQFRTELLCAKVMQNACQTRCASF